MPVTVRMPAPIFTRLFPASPVMTPLSVELKPFVSMMPPPPAPASRLTARAETIPASVLSVAPLPKDRPPATLPRLLLLEISSVPPVMTVPPR